MIDNSLSPSIEIVTDESIAAALERVAAQRCPDLRLECLRTGERFEVERVRVDTDNVRLHLYLTAQGLLRERFDSGVGLTANFGAECIGFVGLDVLVFRAELEPAELVVGNPEKILVTNKRESARVRLTGGVRALVQLQLSGSSRVMDARLLDLSFGGCSIELDLAMALRMQRQQRITEFHIEFPDGTREQFPSTVRYIKVASRHGYATVGFQFIRDAGPPFPNISYLLREMDRETSYRHGQTRSHMLQPSPLFTGGPTSPVALRLDRLARPTTHHDTPMLASLRAIAHVLAAAAINLRQGMPLPVERLHESAATLCDLLAENRAEFLYGLCCLHEQPPLLHHCISVAGRLIDLLQHDSKLAPNLTEIAFAALIHDLGNVRHITPRTSSLDPLITDPIDHRDQHLELLDALGPAESFVAAGIRRAVIESLNQRAATATSGIQVNTSVQDDLSRAATMTDLVDVMTRGLGSRDPQAPLIAFRTLYKLPDDRDRYWLKRYIQRQGLYPIGSMVQFSTGFLAWVLRLDDNGQPVRIRVVASTQNDRRLDTLLDQADFAQVGEITRAVAPQRFGLEPF